MLIPFPKTFNDYKINEEITTIYIKNKKGESFESTIDTSNLQKLIELDWIWSAAWYKNLGYYYTVHTEYFTDGNGKKKPRTVLLHKLLIGCKDEFVDHLNHKSLDNRMCNLRLTSNSDNLKNRNSKNKNNTTGYRNVCYSNGWYIVQLQINGKNKIVGKSKDVHVAGKIAEEMRKKYYKEFAGNN